MRDHPAIDTLSAYLDAELAQEERDDVARHLAECRQCAAQTRALQAATAAVGTLSRVEPTADEHRQLRQSILKARPAGSVTRLPFSQRWALAGGLAIVVIAIAGVFALRSGGPSVSEQASAPASEAGVFDFASPDDVRQTVLALPEVSKASRSSSDSAAKARSEGSDTSDSAPPEAPELFSSRAGSGQDSAPEDQAEAVGGAGGAEGGGGAAGGSGDYAGSTTGSDDGDGGTGRRDSEGAAGFSKQAQDQCLAKVAEAHDRRLFPLLAREARFRGQPAWLLVYASSPSGDASAPLDRVQVYLIPPADCAAESGPPLLERALYRSSFARP
jgi:hypothetical protein